MGELSDRAQDLARKVKNGELDPVSARIEQWKIMMGVAAEEDRLERKITDTK